MAGAELKHEKDKLPILFFKTAKEWEAWLAKNHTTSKGAWLRIYKKDSGVLSIDRPGSLDAALCYGWIDGQANSYDEESYLQRYCPRRPKSIWSKKNIENIARLTAAKKMKPAGLKEVEAAKADGRWEAAYDSPANMQIPGDFLKALAKNAKAKAFFKTLNKTNTFAIGWRLQTAKKPETREKRIKAIIEMLAKGQKFH
jgi:uncharacterized protein YdeI (YjbR/CyaY-like superfamily)